MRNTENFGKKQKARHLIVEKGLSHKDAAEAVGVAENTITAWSKKHKWDEVVEAKVKRALVFSDFLDEHQMPEHVKGHEMLVKRFLAEYLVTVSCIEQKEAASRLRVSENTLSSWSKEGGWKQKRKQALRLLKSRSPEEMYTTIRKRTFGMESGLCDFLQKYYPLAFQQVRLAWTEYLVIQQAKVQSLLNVMRDQAGYPNSKRVKEATFGNESVIRETPPVSTGGPFSSHSNEADENKY